VTSVMGQTEEQQETIEFVKNKKESNSNREWEACGGAIWGVGGGEDC
jgi:hypothetical protein